MAAQAALETYSEPESQESDEEDMVWMLQRGEGRHVPRPPLESREQAESLREKYLEQGVEDVAVVRCARSVVDEVIDR